MEDTLVIALMSCFPLLTATYISYYKTQTLVAAFTQLGEQNQHNQPKLLYFLSRSMTQPPNLRHPMSFLISFILVILFT